MSPVTGSRVLLVLLLAPALFAQKPAASSDVAAIATPARCTDLSGKIPKPCPLGTESTAVVSESTSTGANRCANLAGKEVSCPSSLGTNPGPAVTTEPAREAMHCTNLSGKEVPCPSDAATTVPAAAPTNSGAGSTGCTDLAGRELACPNSVTSGPVATTRQAPAGRSLERSLPANLVQDQKLFWTSPAQLREKDLHWLLPFSVVTAGLIGNDRGIESHLPTNPDTIRRSKDLSNYGAVGFVAGAGAFYLWGRATDNAHMRETGWLSGEALLNSFAVSYAMKGITQRDRPLEGNGRGSFWTGSNPFSSSFPSQHAVAAWSVASVVAHEYPSTLTQFLAYGAAAAVSATRVTGRQHWTSDAFIGSALGWYMGRQVYRAHAGGEDRSQWGTFEPGPRETARDPADMGSPYVPLDSWVYPAIERLAALGYVQTAFLGLRPWTRMECARLLEEAQGALDEGGQGKDSSDVARAYRTLTQEFSPETARRLGARNLSAGIESLYTRVTAISGTPLNDSYHFGQTIYNDYGRPFQEGVNAVVGVSSRAAAGPLSFYVRGEYQHAPFAPAASDQVRNLIASVDGLPAAPAVPFSEVNRLQLLDAYVTVGFSNWQLSFGQQSLWWGPGRGTSLMFTNNAQPIPMLRLDQVSPITLPSIGKWLGPIHSTVLIGQLRGHRFVFQPPQYGTFTGDWKTLVDPQPYLHAEKLSLKPTPNLEIGVTLIAEFSGPGVPFTFKNFLRTFNNYSTGRLNNGNRQTGFQFSYRLPGLRKWLTLYNDSMAEDEPNPVVYPRRSAMNPGIYLSHFPRLPKLDFRVEGVYTDLPNLKIPGVYYQDIRYRNGMTNYGNILGSWVGREGRGIQAWSNYWVAPRKVISLSYRYANVSKGFLPNGGSLNDFSVGTEWLLKPQLALSGSVQYEHWAFPVLSTNRQSVVTASFQITYWPKWQIGK